MISAAKLSVRITFDFGWPAQLQDVFTADDTVI
jgi:hypothetical protein